MPTPPRTPTGQFPPGTSGNPRGRPPKSTAVVRHDSAPRTVPRRDGWHNSASGHGTSRDRRMLTQYGADVVTDIEALQLRRSEFLAAAIIEQGPKDALRRGWSLKCEDKELSGAIAKQAEALGLDEILYEAWTKEFEAGGSAIFPVLTGALGDLAEPLDEGAIASVDAFHVFEPQELTPHDYYTDIRDPKFRRPMTYRLVPLTTGRAGWMPPTVIHETRLVIFPGQRHTVQTQPGQRMSWGDSVLCRPRQVIADFGLAWGSAATLLASHGGGTLAMDGFTNLMATPDGMTQFDNYIASMEMSMSTLRMRVIDAKDTFTRESSTLSGVADTLDKFATLIAAAARRPVSILMGRGETGLRTGDDDTRSWYATVEGDRAKHLLPRHQQIIRLMLLATAGPAGGKEPEGWGIEYPPLWSPSEKEIADTRKVNMDRAVAAVNAQIVSADDVADSFYPEDGDGKGDVRGDIHINWKRRKAQAVVQSGPGDLSAEDRAAMGDEDQRGDRVPVPRGDAADQARDYHGRFAAGHGAAHDEARASRAASDAGDVARARAHMDGHRAHAEEHARTAATRAAHEERVAIANEHQAITAGHVHAVPTAKLGEYAAVHDRLAAEAGTRKAALDEHQAIAARAMARMHAHADDAADIGAEVHRPHDAHEAASNALGHVAGHTGGTQYEAHHTEHESIGERPGDGASAAEHAAYNAAHAARTAAYNEHAAAAQTSLEQLHEHQVRAVGESRQALRDHDRAAAAMHHEAEAHAEHGVNESAFAAHRDENGDLAGSHEIAHDNAGRAAETMSSAELTRREEISSTMRDKLEDAHDALKEATRNTAVTIRDLARVTGRPARLSKPAKP